MSDVAIRVEGLGKQYRIGKSLRSKTLRETIAGAVGAPIRAVRSTLSKNFAASEAPNTIWALRDVGFEVKRGEVVGIIGRNGAGKSTLLKILSRVTQPTEGLVDLHGRAASLLEVGTGFHSELTGRENIYLNGSILGMRKSEIQRKFDQIVGFAEIESFLDTPVKHYSTGMYMRLAFAVAAHLDSEILVVDEVLAVGDSAFQKKCLSKMGEVSRAGRTVLLVSHQLNQIRRLCERSIWLEGGRIHRSGSTVDVLGSYEAPQALADGHIRESSNHVSARFLHWEIVDPHGHRPHTLESLGAVTIRFVLNAAKPVRNGHHGVALFNAESQLMWAAEAKHLQLEPGIHEFVYALPSLPLRPGTYYWRVTLYDDRGPVDDWMCQPELTVGTEPIGHSRDEWIGVLNMPFDFKIGRWAGPSYDADATEPVDRVESP